jgi:predicted nucleotidyltransferase
LATQAREKAVAAAHMLSAHPGVELVYLFGSAADPEQTVVRDIDLAVLTRPPLDTDELLRLRADVVTAVGGPIDLVSLNRAPVVLAHEVAEHGRCLFARTPEAETEFVIRARARYWDFKPFLETQWRYAGERLKERSRGT